MRWWTRLREIFDTLREQRQPQSSLRIANSSPSHEDDTETVYRGRQFATVVLKRPGQVNVQMVEQSSEPFLPQPPQGALCGCSSVTVRLPEAIHWESSGPRRRRNSVMNVGVMLQVLPMYGAR